MAAAQFVQRAAKQPDATNPYTVFATPLTNAEIKEALKAGSSDFLFLWDQCKVGIEM